MKQHYNNADISQRAAEPSLRDSGQDDQLAPWLEEAEQIRQAFEQRDDIPTDLRDEVRRLDTPEKTEKWVRDLAVSLRDIDQSEGEQPAVKQTPTARNVARSSVFVMAARLIRPKGCKA